MMSSTSSAWTLPLLLLPLVVSFLQSSCATCRGLHEFSIQVETLEELVQGCPENCSSDHRTDRRCMCFNLSVPQVPCPFPGYFIQGLTSLQLNTSAQSSNVSRLIMMLNKLKCPETCTISVNYEPVVSLKGLYIKLKDISQQMKILRA